jgi:hypothetical protein
MTQQQPLPRGSQHPHKRSKNDALQQKEFYFTISPKALKQSAFDEEAGQVSVFNAGGDGEW